MSNAPTHEQSKWKKLLMQMGVNTLIYSILSMAAIAVMFTFFLPFMRELLAGAGDNLYANAIVGIVTVIIIAPFLRAMVMKKNRSEEWRALWAESNRNRLPLIFTIIVRAVIAIAFIFYICHKLSHFTNALMITIGVIVVALIVVSRAVKRRSITLERLFVQNLRSRDIEAQVHGKKRPLYEGRLLDRDIHIADFQVPFNSMWMGSTLKQLDLGRKYGVHISSIMRGGMRINIPDGDYVIFPYDVLQVIGSDEQFTAFREALEKEVLGEDYDWENREMKLRQLVIGEDSPFVGKSLIESGIRDLYSCMVVGLEEGKESLSRYVPTRKFQSGDIIWVVGEQESLDALMSC
jgi:CPA2 family monovalent cation:H+ antiporter-2